MSNLKRIVTDGSNRTLLFLVISAASIIISFFDIGNLPFDAAWIAVIICGIPIFIEAAVGLVKDHDIKAGLLVSIALFASLYIGEIFAAGEIALIMGIGEALEERTVRKARAGIEKLIDLNPSTARLVCDGKEDIIASSEIKVGDTLRILAGETIPADGVILIGKTSVDQSVLTGESLPVDKEEGDDVFSGTVNQFGTFDMRVVIPEEDSSLQKMIRLIQSADAGRAKIVRTADRWATWIVVVALVSAISIWLITDEVIRAVTILVVFCPCALVLATPTAIVAAIGNVTKYGIIVKEGDAIERMATVNRLVFDKTGTLTYGRPAVTDILSFNDSYSVDDILSMVASSELRSEHPLGKAIVNHAKNKVITLLEPEEFNMLLGRGVSAKVNGHRMLVGNERLMRDHDLHMDIHIQKNVFEHIGKGRTVVYVAVDEKIAGMIVISDVIRDESKEMIDDLQMMGVRCTLLTGDSAPSTIYIAGLSGMNDFKSDQLPEDKVRSVMEFEKNGERICMIGDGVNDAPALKAATVGVAMGKIGSDIAIDASDITLVGDDIENIPHLVGLSKKTMRKIKLNLTFSLSLNFIAIFLAMTGILDPVMGALVHNAGSIIVILNSALLLSWKYKKGATPRTVNDRCTC